MKSRKFFTYLLSFVLVSLLSFSVQAAEPIRIGFIEPLSGPIASVGLEGLDAIRLAADRVNARGGVLGGRMIEIVPLDNAMKAEKTTQQVKKAIDMGLRFISQGIGSNHALNIIKTLNKHNKRNPDKAIVYFNHSAVTPAFTNEMCSFWHFRFDADANMKISALVTQIGKNPKIKKLYTLNQNYAYGKAVQAAVNRYLKELAPNVELVGDDLMIPFGKVQDFTPYVAKVAASKADAVLTGNWGPDFIRFAKAVAAAGLDVDFYSIYAGIPTSVKGYGEETGIKLRIKQITESHINDEDRAEVKAINAASLKKHKRTWYSDRYRIMIEMFAAALDKAGTDDPVAVAYALEGMTIPGPHGDTIVMRAENHQIAMPMVVSSIDPNAPIKFVYGGETFGIGWKTDGWVSTAENTLPTTCKMKRPPKP
ncbi:MAG TPA: branched-chain amino acid ABC transporter substrate-binding protein [Desulfobacterales bacterium]|nr:branched-chain amino acid ABC transporter substrate-binding protein [Desulfobacterales bacterium]